MELNDTPADIPINASIVDEPPKKTKKPMSEAQKLNLQKGRDTRLAMKNKKLADAQIQPPVPPPPLPTKEVVKEVVSVVETLPPKPKAVRKSRAKPKLAPLTMEYKDSDDEEPPTPKAVPQKRPQTTAPSPATSPAFIPNPRPFGNNVRRHDAFANMTASPNFKLKRF